MSDPIRKDLSTKAKETITPDILKSDTQKAKEAATDTADRVAREGQPDSTKSKLQDTFDKTERGKDNTKHGSTHETVGDKIKSALGFDNKKDTTVHDATHGTTHGTAHTTTHGTTHNTTPSTNTNTHF